MNDPRLNSAHLPFPRRECYREYRQGVLDARGALTAEVEAWQDAEFVVESDIDRPWPPPARYRLRGKTTSDLHPLKIGINTLGRLANNDIVRTCHSVSRRHCVIRVHASGGCEVHDTDSTNGTWVNSQCIYEPTALAHGDVVQAGKEAFILEIGGVPEGLRETANGAADASVGPSE